MVLLLNKFRAISIKVFQPPLFLRAIVFKDLLSGYQAALVNSTQMQLRAEASCKKKLPGLETNQIHKKFAVCRLSSLVQRLGLSMLKASEKTDNSSTHLFEMRSRRLDLVMPPPQHT